MISEVLTACYDISAASTLDTHLTSFVSLGACAVLSSISFTWSNHFFVCFVDSIPVSQHIIALRMLLHVATRPNQSDAFGSSIDTAAPVVYLT